VLSVLHTGSLVAARNRSLECEQSHQTRLLHTVSWLRAWLRVQVAPQESDSTPPAPAFQANFHADLISSHRLCD